MKPRKPTASDRTVSMFTGQTPVEERPIEVIEEEPHEGARVTLEQDANRLRDMAFQGQEWTSKAFGEPDADGNTYRVSHKGVHYYVETLAKAPGTAGAYGYVGLMVHDRDLLNLTKVMVQAVRDKQARETPDDGTK